MGGWSPAGKGVEVESTGGSREVHPEVSEHALKEDAIGFRDALIIGIASTGSAYSLAALIVAREILGGIVLHRNGTSQQQKEEG
jgi:hypothetical protein